MRLPPVERAWRRARRYLRLTDADIAGIRSAWRAFKAASSVAITDLLATGGNILGDWRSALATYLLPMLGFGAKKRRDVKHANAVQEALETPPPPENGDPDA